MKKEENETLVSQELTSKNKIGGGPISNQGVKTDLPRHSETIIDLNELENTLAETTDGVSLIPEIEIIKKKDSSFPNSENPEIVSEGVKENLLDDLQKELNSTSLPEKEIPEIQITQPIKQLVENSPVEDSKIQINQPIEQPIKTFPIGIPEQKKVETKISKIISPFKKPQENKIKETPKIIASEKINKEKTPVAIRTYRDDLANVVKKDRISLSKAIIAEEESKNNKSLKIFSKIKQSTKRKIYLTGISIFLVLSGIVSVFFVYYYKQTPIIKVDSIELKSFIYSEYQREVFTENPNSIKLTKLIQTELDSASVPIGSLLHLYLTKRHQKNDGVIGKSIINTTELLSLLGSRVSEVFLRFIEPDFMYGYYTSLDSYPFLILKTRSFENSFPEMLKWEDNLIEDLRPIFIEQNPAISLNELQSVKFEFKDIIIKNKDVRAVLDNSGEIIFVYVFVDKYTIVITTNKIALQEIIDRLTISYRER